MVTARSIITEAKGMLGTPFCHFGSSRMGVDCSGLVYVSHYKSGLALKRCDRKYSARWWISARKEERLINGLKFNNFEFTEEKTIGGLVLFTLYRENVPVNHCGIMISEDEFIHAKCGYRPGQQKVSIDPLHSGYLKRLAGYMINTDVDYSII